MKVSDFKSKAAGRILRHEKNYVAFVPHDLPPKLEPSWVLSERLSRADRALSELAGIAQSLPNPNLLVSPFMRREAVLSSRIEGTQASLSDLFLFESAKLLTPEASDVKEVSNYVDAMKYGLKRLKEFPLSLRFICELHGVLLRRVRGDSTTPGQFRTSQNWIGPAGCTLNNAVFVPPPVPEMKQALHQFERYLYKSSEFPPLIRMALIHYQFEAIHPFIDGNGRIGRLLISLLLCHEKVIAHPLLYLSAYFERHRDEYYGHLLAVSREGAWEKWIEFFLNGIAEQALDAKNRIDHLHSLWQQHRAAVSRARSSALLLRLIEYLMESPVITIPLAAKLLRVTQKSAALNVNKLVDLGILEEVSGRERKRIYLCEPVVKVLEAIRFETTDK